MRKNEGRTVGLFFKVSPEEMGLIEKRWSRSAQGTNAPIYGRWR